MKSWKTFLSNSTLLSVTEMLNKGFPFIIILLVVRFLGVQANGQMAGALALAGLLTLFTDIGLSTLLVRDVSRDNAKASHYFSTIVSFKTALSLAVLAIGSLLVYFTKDANVHAIFIIGLFYILLDNMNVNVFQSGLRAIGKVNHEATSKFIRGITLFTGGLVGVLWVGTIEAVLIGYCISAGIQLIVNLVFTHKNTITIRFSFNGTEWKRFLGLSKQFFINNVLYMVYYSIDTTMISYIKGDVETGVYNAAYVFFSAFYALGSVLNMAIFPLFSKIFLENKQEWMKLYKRVAAFTALFSLIGMAALIVLGPYFMPFVVDEPEQVGGAIVGLQILSSGLLFAFQNTIFGALFNSSGNEKRIVVPGLFGMIVNVSLNAVVIPLYGLYGAAATTVITEFTVMLIFFYLYRKHVRI